MVLTALIPGHFLPFTLISPHEQRFHRYGTNYIPQSSKHRKFICFDRTQNVQNIDDALLFDKYK